MCGELESFGRKHVCQYSNPGLPVYEAEMLNTCNFCNEEQRHCIRNVLIASGLSVNKLKWPFLIIHT